MREQIFMKITYEPRKGRGKLYKNIIYISALITLVAPL